MKKSVSKGARKMDDGKLPVMRGVFLRFPYAMQEIARVSALGAEKYEVRLGTEEDQVHDVEDGFGRYTDAMGRHLLNEAMKGFAGAVSIETGGALPPQGRRVLEAAQTAWNAIERLEMLVRDLNKAGMKVEDVLAQG